MGTAAPLVEIICPAEVFLSRSFPPCPLKGHWSGTAVDGAA